MKKPGGNRANPKRNERKKMNERILAEKTQVSAVTPCDETRPARPLASPKKIYIRTAKDVHAALGKRVAWDHPLWVKTISGMLEATNGKNVLIDGDWKWRPSLINLHVAESEDHTDTRTRDLFAEASSA